jgi:hypothetical protein
MSYVDVIIVVVGMDGWAGGRMDGWTVGRREMTNSSDQHYRGDNHTSTL